jgi:acetolactate synthase-1/2/3 large subunit
MVKPITKCAHLLRSSEDIANTLDDVFNESISGRPGPAWLDIPVDLQGALLPEYY